MEGGHGGEAFWEGSHVCMEELEEAIFSSGFYFQIQTMCFPSGIGQSSSEGLTCTYGGPGRNYLLPFAVDSRFREHIFHVFGSHELNLGIV